MIIYSSTDAWESETGWLVEKSEYDNLAAELAAANARADAAEQRLLNELAKEPCQNCTHGKAWHEGGKCSNACHCGKYVAQLTSQSPHAGEILPQLIEYQAELHRDALRRLGEAQHGADELRRQLAEAQAELARVRAWVKENAEHAGRCGVWDTRIEVCTCGYDALVAPLKELP